MIDFLKLDPFELLNPDLKVWRIKNFFGTEILDFCEQNILNAEFSTRKYGETIGESTQFDEDVSQSEKLVFIKQMMRDKELIKTIAERTEKPALKGCLPRIYKFEPNSGQHFGWHGDNSEGRTIGFSVNLTKNKFEGGSFMMRKISEPHTHFEYQNTGYGDAIFFSIGLGLQHCVQPVTGTQTRYACAGWFIV